MDNGKAEKESRYNFWNNQYNLITAAALLGLIAGILLITFWPQNRGESSIPYSPTPSVSHTVLPSRTPSPSPTRTPSPSPIPTDPDHSTTTPTPYAYQFTPRHGTLILSIRKAKHYQLFAYQPFASLENDQMRGLPLTQITSSDDDKIHPALSPDGRKLAYASNRSGSWDIYIWDLTSGDQRQFTSTHGYEAYPSWSPDGQWITYESYQGDNLEILIQNAEDQTHLINLSNHPGADFSPHWSPQGRKISYISTRNGSKQILVADLDNPGEEKAAVHNGTDNPEIYHPVWSPGGRYLGWSARSSAGYQEIYLWDSRQSGSSLEQLGPGTWSVWDSSGTLLYTIHETPTAHYLTAYPLGMEEAPLLLPPLKLPGTSMGITWAEQVSLENALLSSGDRSDPGGESWPFRGRSGTANPRERQDLISLAGVQAPNPKLNQQAVEAFLALKERISDLAGWDFLSVLDNAYLTLTTPLEPSGGERWLYTGRAFQVSDLPRQAGWVVIIKEDFAGQTYWRLYLRTRDQTGRMGMPLKDYPWDFDARFNGRSSAYEQGGSRAGELPEGYWIDFTDLAWGYGWNRFPALPRWQTAYPHTRWRLFSYAQGLTWEQAMLELYPDVALVTPTPPGR